MSEQQAEELKEEIETTHDQAEATEDHPKGDDPEATEDQAQPDDQD